MCVENEWPDQNFWKIVSIFHVTHWWKGYSHKIFKIYKDLGYKIKHLDACYIIIIMRILYGSNYELEAYKNVDN